MTQKYADMLFEDERMILLVVTIYLSFSTWLMENVKELTKITCNPVIWRKTIF